MAAVNPYPFPSMPPPTQGMVSSGSSSINNHGVLGANNVTTSFQGGDHSLNHSSDASAGAFDFSDPDLDIYALLIMAGSAGGNVIDPEDQDYMNKLTHYLMGIGGSIVCCLGTIANAMSVAVLTRPVMKSSTYMYLAALAVCDSLVLFFTLLLVLKDTRPPDSPHQLDMFHAILYPFVHPTAIVFQVTSIWLTLAFTVDRYIMICHPFKAEHMCRKSRARRVVVGIYLGGFVFNIPKYLENYTKTDEFKIANSTHVYKTYGVMTTEIGNNELFRKIVHSWGYLIFVCGIPFLTLVILNAFLIRAVRESRLKGKEINPKEKHRNDTTIMLIGVIIIFLICQGPALASRMTYAFKPGTTRNRAYFTLNEVASFLVILNSAINIVPYYLFGRKFRSEFWRIFCACFMDKDEIRRMARSYSVSMDHRRLSNYNVMEMNGIGKSKNEIDASNNGLQRCGTGTTNTASFNSNLYDETASPTFGRRKFSKSGSSHSFGDFRLCEGVAAGGSGDGGSGESGQYLALPLIHNGRTSSPSSPLPSHPADSVAEASKGGSNVETPNLSSAVGANSRPPNHIHRGASPSLSTASMYNYLSNLGSELFSDSYSCLDFPIEENENNVKTPGADDRGCNAGAENSIVGGGCGSGIDSELNPGNGHKVGSTVTPGSGSGGCDSGEQMEHNTNNSINDNNINNESTVLSPLLPHVSSIFNNTSSSPPSSSSIRLPPFAADQNYKACRDAPSHNATHQGRLSSNDKTAAVQDRNTYPPPLLPPPPPVSLPSTAPSPSSSSLSSSTSRHRQPTTFTSSSTSSSLASTNYVSSSPVPSERQRMMKDVMVSANTKGGSSSCPQGKYMSLATSISNTTSNITITTINNNNNKHTPDQSTL